MCHDLVVYVVLVCGGVEVWDKGKIFSSLVKIRNKRKGESRKGKNVVRQRKGEIKWKEIEFQSIKEVTLIIGNAALYEKPNGDE